MRLTKFTQLPSALKAYAQTVIALKSLENGKEAQKVTALQALQEMFNQGMPAQKSAEKCLLAVSNNHFFQFDINPQQHPEFDPEDQSPEIRAVVDAQAEIKAAHARLAAAINEARAAGRIKVSPKDSIRLEVLSPDKVKPIKKKYGARIKQLMKSKDLMQPVLAA